MYNNETVAHEFFFNCVGDGMDPRMKNRSVSSGSKPGAASPESLLEMKPQTSWLPTLPRHGSSLVMRTHKKCGHAALEPHFRSSLKVLRVRAARGSGSFGRHWL